MMGLDMYLSQKIYMWSTERGTLSITGAKTPVRGEKVQYIVEEVGYWRKANAIHRWFVDNVQGGNDDCGEYYVSEETLQELLDLVNRVLEASELVDGDVVNGYKIDSTGKHPMIEQGKVVKDPSVAEELLPTTEGFFFGSTNYDQYYIEDLKLTKEIIETALNDKRGEFYYSSSW